MKFLKLIFGVLCLWSMQAQAQSPLVPDSGYAGSACSAGCCCKCGMLTPLGVSTGHTMLKGEWMASYSYMNTNMAGDRIGAATASDAAVYKSYAMSPETMQMQMQMVMVMYGLTGKITLMAMGGFMSNYMTMNMNMSMQMPGMNMGAMSQGSSSSAYGMSDTKVYGLYRLKQTDDDRVVGSLGLSLPTGSISATGLNMYSGANTPLAYMMQLGTGSYSVLPSLTYVHTRNKLSLGASGGADIKVNNNADGYRWGNVYNATAWGAYRVLPFLGLSLRAEWVNAGRISGSDKDIINPVMAGNIEFDPTADPRNSGGTWVNTYVGANLHFNKPVLKNFNFQAEYGLPVYQNLNGTQMSNSNYFLAGVSYVF